MVPIYQAPAIVPHAVLEEEKAIIRAEGWFHVAKAYFANAFDADRMRRVEAERRVAEMRRDERATSARPPVATATSVPAMSRRRAITTVGSLAFFGFFTRWFPRHAAALAEPAQHKRDIARKAFYDLVPLWHRAPEGPVKEWLWREQYRASVESGLFVVRDRELDRELGLEV